MPEADPLHAAYHEYQDALVQAGLLVRSGVPGVYGLGGAFHEVIERFDRYLTRIGNRQRPEVVRFPPLLNRASYEKTDHLETFPNLMGSVHSFRGSDKDHLELSRMKASGEDWSKALDATATMMTPAVCYPLYPTATGTLPVGGRTFDLRGFVFRHEPSADPARMQIVPDARVRPARHSERGARASRLLAEARRGDPARGRARREARRGQRPVLRPRRSRDGGDASASRP